MNPKASNSQRIVELLQPARRVLLITHVAPDGDAIGSLLGMGRLLSDQGKACTLACADPVPEIYSWLPGTREIVRRPSGAYDLLIVLDCSDARRMGSVFDDSVQGLPLINIDHHVTNTRFGTVNWVEPASVSTTQMVLALVEALDWSLDPAVATCLLTGLVTDTQSFRTSNVDAAALRAALQLMEAGAPLSEISQRSLSQRPLASVRVWGEAIDRLQLDDDILWTEVTREMLERWSVGGDGVTGLTNLLSGVREGRVVIVFSELEDRTVDVGMRAAPGWDVAQVALRLGGGGHPQAAGCTLEGDLAQVRKRVLAEVRSSLAS
jgi:phosphoesterase RecJ-like protein